MPSSGTTPVVLPEPATATTAPIVLQRLLDLLGDDEAAIDELLVMFQQSLVSMQQRLQQARHHDRQALKPLAHELKGGAANIGAETLTELARKLENAALANNSAEMDGLVDAIEAECGHIDAFVTGRNDKRI
ncbi:Hpt domain-containing protein, partial [Rhodoferax sp.]|uniref:Hpt domain-containing protein n=1 Tax=Rhodoferax sp. TaxID=50421 RepID=UPI002622623E